MKRNHEIRLKLNKEEHDRLVMLSNFRGLTSSAFLRNFINTCQLRPGEVKS